MSFLKGLFGKKKTKRERPPSAPRPAVRHRPDFPLGENIVSDAEIKTFADLGRHYPLPSGYEYQEGEDGVPLIVRVQDGTKFSFLIEAGMLTFDEAHTRDGRTRYKTTEVFKRRS